MIRVLYPNVFRIVKKLVIFLLNIEFCIQKEFLRELGGLMGDKLIGLYFFDNWR